MQLESAEDVLRALRDSGLFAPDEFAGLRRELAPLGDIRAVLNHLFKRDCVTRYQMSKVLNGRAADLFVGKYVITDRLGAGGMGKVYRAREVATGRPVALKIVRSSLVENPTVRGRYAREVQTASLLDHPNIVSVFDAGEADGRVYMAMEFIDGIDLSRMMREFEMLAIPEACEYARQIALGLEHAHARGFVHRDVKPSNVVVAGERHVPQATEPAVVKLLDLGLSRALDPLDMVVPDLTRDHTVVGTPDYMAPEQARDSKGVDARADLYALGCTLYFLLTGRVPFPASGAIEKILAHQVELPSPLQGLRPEVPAAVAELVARLMAKRPADRIQTAAEAAEALAPHARYPAGAPPVEVITRAQRKAEAHVDTGSGRSTLPSSGHAAVDQLELLCTGEALAEAPTPEPVRRLPAPRPRAVAKERSAERKPQPAPRRVPRSKPAVLWVGVALACISVLTLALWLASRR